MPTSALAWTTAGRAPRMQRETSAAAVRRNIAEP
jgi:hypothetical protein